MFGHRSHLWTQVSPKNATASATIMAAAERIFMGERPRRRPPQKVFGQAIAPLALSQKAWNSLQVFSSWAVACWPAVIGSDETQIRLSVGMAARAMQRFVPVHWHLLNRCVLPHYSSCLFQWSIA